MGKLLEAYEELEKRAAQEKLINDRVEFLNEMCKTAEAILLEEYGEDNYTAEDIQKVAEFIIAEQASEETESEKVAEWYDQGRIMARGFIAELQASEGN